MNGMRPTAIKDSCLERPPATHAVCALQLTAHQFAMTRNRSHEVFVAAVN